MKYTIVTGAASDIGKAISGRLAANGHNLLLIDIDEQTLNDFANSLKKTQNHLCLPLDFSKVEETEDKLKDFIEKNDIVVVNAVFAAGVFSIKPLRMIKYDYYLKSMNIAIFSILQIMKIVTSRKINKDGFMSAVIISSISAKVGTKGYVLYGTIKAALLGMMRSMAVELAPARINAILPGSIRTKATSFIYEGIENVNPRSLLGEGKPDDIANLIGFLLSDESKWITGQDFVIDGGTTIN